MKRSVWIGLIIGVVVVVAAVFGPGALTASGAEPTACATCHSMKDNAHSFQTSDSAHKTAVGCSDCHITHESFGKQLTSKYATGARHVWVTVTGQTPDQIELRPQDREAIISNCVRCHAGGKNTDGSPFGQEHMKNVGKDSCLNCHTTNPHGDKGN